MASPNESKDKFDISPWAILFWVVVFVLIVSAVEHS